MTYKSVCTKSFRLWIGACVIGIWSGASFAELLEYLDNPIKYCYQIVGVDPKYEPLKHGSLSKESTFVRYAKNNKASPVERNLIAQYMTEIDNCRNRQDASRWRIDNGDAMITATLDSAYASYVGLAVRLYNGEITYGEFHKLNDAESASYKQRAATRGAELERIDAQAESQSSADNQADAQRRAAIMQQGIQGFQKSLQPAPTVRSSCTFLAGQMQCISR